MYAERGYLGKWTAFIQHFSILPDKALYNVASHSPIHSPMAAMQGDDLTIRSNSGFSVLLKDTLMDRRSQELNCQPGA